MCERYDVIIIGSGAGGGTLAHRLAPPSGTRILSNRTCGFPASGFPTDFTVDPLVHGEHGSDPTEPPASKPYPAPPVSHEPRIQKLSDDRPPPATTRFPRPQPRC